MVNVVVAPRGTPVPTAKILTCLMCLQSSGFGFRGGVGRCFPVWEQFTECMSKAPEVKLCANLRDDYFECLHHKKE